MPKCDGAMHVKGDSMDPPIKEGDIICFKMTQSRRGGLFFGQVYLLDFDLDGEDHLAIKRVFESDEPGYYRLESNNPDYEPVEIPRDCVRAMAMVKTEIKYKGF